MAPTWSMVTSPKAINGASNRKTSQRSSFVIASLLHAPEPKEPTRQESLSQRRQGPSQKGINSAASRPLHRPRQDVRDVLPMPRKLAPVLVPPVYDTHPQDCAVGDPRPRATGNRLDHKVPLIPSWRPERPRRSSTPSCGRYQLQDPCFRHSWRLALGGQ